MLHICSQRSLLGEKGTSIFYDLYPLPHSKFLTWQTVKLWIWSNKDKFQLFTNYYPFERDETSKTSRENAWKIPERVIFYSTDRTLRELKSTLFRQRYEWVIVNMWEVCEYFQSINNSRRYVVIQQAFIVLTLKALENYSPLYLQL